MSWYATMNIEKEWKASDKDKTKCGELIDAVVAWLTKWNKHRADEEIKSLIRRLKTVKTRGTKRGWDESAVAAFDKVWNSVYNWCDYTRVWVKTF